MFYNNSMIEVERYVHYITYHMNSPLHFDAEETENDL